MIMIEIKQTKERKRRNRKKVAGFFWKAIITVVVVHGMSCVTMSYILAFMYRDQVVESVSSTIVTEIIAPVVVGLLSKTLENIFEKNELSFSKPIKQAPQETQSSSNESEGSVG